MSARAALGSAQYLTRRIPQNPKYQHVKTRLDTGNSLSKYMEKLEEIKRNYRYKKDELFKRLKVTTFAQLVLQVASLSDETLEVTSEELHKLEDAAAPGEDSEVATGTNGKGSPEEAPNPVLFLNSTGPGESQRSTLQSVISGVGEMDIEKDSRLKVLAQKIPEGLITGTLPLSCQAPAPPGSARRKTSPRVPPTRAENKWRFSADDLQKLKYYLEEEHIPLDTASRLSRGISSRDSKPTSMRSSPSLHGSNAGSLSSRTLSRTNLQNRPWK
ncbi:centrosomal protein of 41 kDa [Neopelma chrysocephalum]|uniref:centrosomal protein of 41 kDa n=1 Tax=Neopelma chrysocephalum TaxID=114329 RepID=UPI000FCD25F4|nr:centrosomal protein of 41 kDa [Neopelma chrysocephalum]